MFSDFVKTLPEGLVYAAIYRKGAQMPSGKLAGGKNRPRNPLTSSRVPPTSPSPLSETLDIQAVGIFTGIRGNGIVILDIDRNLDKVLALYGDTLDRRSKNYIDQEKGR